MGVTQSRIVGATGSIWVAGQMSLTKFIVVVDEHVDEHVDVQDELAFDAATTAMVDRKGRGYGLA